MNDWINAIEDPPIDSGLILGWDTKKGYVLIEYDVGATCYWNQNGDEMPNVIYWCELPEQP